MTEVMTACRVSTPSTSYTSGLDSETDSGSSLKDTETEVDRPSILNVLHTPKQLLLSRKRRVLRNKSAILSGEKRRKGSSSASSEPKSVTPQQRVKEFRGENLVVSRGKLFCSVCREEISLKSSSVKKHLRSAKHAEGKEKIAKKDKREQEIAIALKAHNEEIRRESSSRTTSFQSEDCYGIFVLCSFS